RIQLVRIVAAAAPAETGLHFRRTEADDADAVRPELGLPALADPAHRPLAAAVGRAACGTLHAGSRRDVDDFAVSLSLHRRDDPVGDVDQPEDVRVEHLPHLAEIDAADFGAIRVASIVDEHVDAAHAIRAGLHSARVVFGARHVGAYTV